MAVNIIVLIIVSFIFVSFNNINLLTTFILKNKIYIGILISLIFIPLLIKEYKKFNIKKDKINIFYLIILGFSLSIFYNTIVFYLNNYFHFTNIYDNNSYIISTIICSGILGPIMEELMFRGIVYNNLKKIYNIRNSILILTLVFGLIHFNIIQIIYAIIIGFVLVYTYEKCNNIKAPIIIHMASNITSTLFIYINSKILFIFCLVLIICFIKYTKCGIINKN